MADGKCVIVCRTCSDEGGLIALVPFVTYAHRGKWAALHTQGTGHDSWLCLDGWVSAAQVETLLRPTEVHPWFTDLRAMARGWRSDGRRACGLELDAYLDKLEEQGAHRA